MRRFAGDGALQGELRGTAGRAADRVLESTDAGALFRFTDTYSRMIGGQMWIAMDPPTPEGAAPGRPAGRARIRRQGRSGARQRGRRRAQLPAIGVQFSRMRVEFTRAPGKMSIHEGLVTGPMVGATIDGVMDYAGNELHMRGTFVPLYGLNSAFGEIPIVGVLLGGKEGLIGSMTYEVVGTPGAPVLRVNPISHRGAGHRAQVPGIPEQPSRATASPTRLAANNDRVGARLAASLPHHCAYYRARRFPTGWSAV